MSVSIPKHMNVRMRKSLSDQMDFHTASAAALASNLPFSLCVASAASKAAVISPRTPALRASSKVPINVRTQSIVLATMKPVLGCTMPAVPPMPSVRCGNVGNTPPIGMRQYSSSCTSVTLTPRWSSLSLSLSFKSSKSRPGRATRLVSSRKTSVSEKGIAYKKVGNLSFCSLNLGLKCSSRQSMNNIVSSGNGCFSTVATMPNAAW